jgi:hypothetical protein
VPPNAPSARSSSRSEPSDWTDPKPANRPLQSVPGTNGFVLGPLFASILPRLRPVPGVLGRCLAPGDWTGFTSIPTRNSKGAWHRVGGLAKVPGTGLGGWQRCLAPGWGVWFASIQAGRSRCQAPGKWMRFASIPTQGPQLVPGTGLAAVC